MFLAATCGIRTHRYVTAIALKPRTLPLHQLDLSLTCDSKQTFIAIFDPFSIVAMVARENAGYASRACAIWADIGTPS